MYLFHLKKTPFHTQIMFPAKQKASNLVDLGGFLSSLRPLQCPDTVAGGIRQPLGKALIQMVKDHHAEEHHNTYPPLSLCTISTLY